MPLQVFAEQREQVVEVIGQRGVKGHVATGRGVLEGEVGGVQGLATKGAQPLGHQRVGAARHHQSLAVDRIADERIADVRQVDTNLVGAPRGELHAYVGVGTETLHHTVVRDGLATIAPHRHSQTVGFMSTDGCIYRTAARHHADAYRLVFARDGTRRQLRHQPLVGLGRAGHHHQSARVLVEPVDDTGARQRRQRRVAVQQRVHQGAARIAGPGVHHEARRFVQHEHVGILMAHIDGQVLRHGLHPRGFFGHHHHGFAAHHEVLGAWHGAVHRDAAGIQPGAKAGAGIIGKGLGEGLIDSTPRQPG